MGTSSRVAARDARVTTLGVIGFAVALAAASQVAIPVPGTPVPMTLQPLVVALAGLWLGPVAGATSMVLYLVAGTAGLPVFAPMGAPGFARLFGPTGGYLWAYPVAAFVAGLIVNQRRTFAFRALAAAAAIAVVHLGGFLQLLVLTGSAAQAVALGAVPFIPLDLVKVLAAAALSSTTPRATA
ncbi:MAG TPA: biotin transporter BioY [Gemmatimonadaceae bacterium]|nr:biotin transporter BioY [Gemmatimonadaceae bacterium]